ncbi:hypothetical protein D1871_12165 [Nakamurella silvestris]|nr:hypothetical protein D1871_12165 [Nakamurella silvestris]
MTTAFESGNKQRTKSGAAAKAYLKRQRRSELMGLAVADAEPTESVRRVDGSLATRVPFLILLFVILAGGVGGVLALNTMTDESGLRTEKAATTSADLQLQIEQLQAEISSMDNVTALDKAARDLGLVPAGDAAILLLDKKGAVSVVGTPAPVPAPGAPAPGTGTTTGEGAVAQTQGAG